MTIETLELSVDAPLARTRWRGFLPAMVCILLLLAFELLTLFAVRHKSPTFDEPLHAMAASVALNSHDFRMDYDNPPLWKYWAALPGISHPLVFDSHDALWQRIPHELGPQWTFMINTLYHMPNHPDRLIGRGHYMMSLLAAGIGALIAIWTWRIAGPVAAIFATFLFALDPNFIAHGVLVKNDVVVVLLFVALGYACFRLGHKITIARLLAVGLICGAGCSVKFSGVVLPIVAMLLIALRASGAPWRCFRGVLQSNTQRMLAMLAIWMVIAALTITVIWASYGFRFSVAVGPSVRIDTQRMVDNLAQRQSAPGQVWSAPITVRVALWGLKHHVLPEAWWNGLLYIYVGTQSRFAFLLVNARQINPWPFYSLAMLVKTPLATLAAILLGLWGIIRSEYKPHRWTVYCLIIPPLIYSLFVINGPAAAGLRHVLVFYPFLFIAIGIGAAHVWRHLAGKWIIAILGLCLMSETLLAFPNYIAFFNLAAGQSRLRLLGDSNLDWGQDLPLLAHWHHQHPDRRLYLSYFGSADPAHYSIHYTNLPGGELFGTVHLPTAPGVIAISATNLQGIYPSKNFDLQKLYSPLWHVKPIAVLGGSIYLFDYPLPDGTRLK